MTSEEAQKMCEEFAAKMHEHFDHVQILVTWNEEGLTKRVARGAGNWYARQGMAHEFINMDIAQDTAFQIADKLKSRDDDGDDDWKAAK